uniref:Actin n=1 Tax=Lotharella oceanica TaxID=641309 RepID=A0A7S2TMT5_9EUKA|mmetsp:Transcript_19713/g.37078  ORF Transcript_19713/g.37078 Transcript_19713/m.37078 type:complete len:296 (+) Transcript_19713:347-1234(+)
MESIWSYTFDKQLVVDPKEKHVLRTQNPSNPTGHKDKMTDLMFDKFDVPAVYVAQDAVLALYAFGRSTGVVIDSGMNMSRVVPVYEGYHLPHAVNYLNLGGKDVTDHMVEMYTASGTFTKNMYSDKNELLKIMNRVKEACSYVSLYFDEDMKKNETKNFVLPDGKSINLKRTFLSSEILFKPSFVGCEQHSLSELIQASIAKCDSDVMKNLYSNILLAGGNTLLPGFGERIQSEVKSLAGEDYGESVKVHAPSERHHSVWVGGSMMSTLSSHKHLWITKAEYEECGPSIIRRKTL